MPRLDEIEPAREQRMRALGRLGVVFVLLNRWLGEQRHDPIRDRARNPPAVGQGVDHIAVAVVGIHDLVERRLRELCAFVAQQPDRYARLAAADQDVGDIMGDERPAGDGGLLGRSLFRGDPDQVFIAKHLGLLQHRHGHRFHILGHSAGIAMRQEATARQMLGQGRAHRLRAALQPLAEDGLGMVALATLGRRLGIRSRDLARDLDRALAHLIVAQRADIGRAQRRIARNTVVIRMRRRDRTAFRSAHTRA